MKKYTLNKQKKKYKKKYFPQWKRDDVKSAFGDMCG